MLLASGVMGLALLSLNVPATLSGLVLASVAGALIYAAVLAILFWADVRRFVTSARA